LSTVSQSTNASESRRIGAPLRPRVYASDAKRSAPRSANNRQISSPSSFRMFAAHVPAGSSRGHVVDDFAAQKSTSGGSSEAEVNELQAMPAGPSPSIAVTTVRPVAK